MDKQQREAQRESVKTLAIAVGVREAARQTGLKESRVLKWSERDHWLKPTPQPPNQSDVVTVVKPSDAMSNVLKDNSMRSKIGFSKAGLKVAEKLGQMDEDELIMPEIAQSAKQWYGVTAGVHGWEGQQQSSNLDINVLAGGRAMIQVVQQARAESE